MRGGSRWSAMCGRFENKDSIPRIAAAWSAEVAGGVGEDAWSANEDVRPTNVVPMLLEGSGRPRRVGLMRWGWARDFAASGQLINARAEDMAGKRTFAEAVQRRRCLVPATAWFEWQANPAGPKAKKVKHRLRPAVDGPWALAGLWEPIPGQQAGAIVVVTVAADPSVAAIHDRMPAIVGLDGAAAWLAGSPDEALALAVPRAGFAEPVV